MPNWFIVKKIVSLNIFNLFCLASHSYFRNYQRVKELNAKIVNNFSVMLEFPLFITAAIHENSTIYHKQRLIFETPCEVGFFSCIIRGIYF